MKTTDYLDAAKKALNVQSDYALAAHLELTRAAVSKLRTARLVMSNTTAAKVAEVLGIPLVKVIADLELERGSNDVLWRRIRAAAVVAAWALATAALLAPDLTINGLARVAYAQDATGIHIVQLLVVLLVVAALARRRMK